MIFRPAPALSVPGRGARIGGATLIGLAGLRLLRAGPLLDPAVQLPALRLGAIAAALLCAVAGLGLLVGFLVGAALPATGGSLTLHDALP